MGRLIGVFGTAGLGREVMSMMHRQRIARDTDDTLVYVAPKAQAPIHGVAVMEEAWFLACNQSRAFVVAISDSKLRQAVFIRALNSGALPYNVRAISAEICDTVRLGEGALVCGYCSITTDTKVGMGFHMNISSYLAHDCIVGDFVTFGPHVVCAGNVIIEDGVYLGAGAMIRQGKPGEPVVIGTGATVGMGAVVTKSVPPGAVVVGIPARPLNEIQSNAK